MKATQASEARYGAPGVSGAAPLATREPVETGFFARAGRAFLSWAKTAAITLGVMYASGWLIATIGVAVLNTRRTVPVDLSNMMERGYKARALRPYALASDPAISPAEAGRAFHSMQPPRSNANGFRLNGGSQYTVVPWRGLVLPEGAFVDARNSSWEGPGPNVITAARGPLSAREREILRLVGTAKVWRDFDLVARAGRVDFIGAQFDLPFAADAHYALMPIPRFSVTKEMAYAAVARAAWHLSEGRAAEAESVLRSIVSYGAVLHDNANSVIEQLIANAVSGIGGDALIRFYDGAGAPRGRAIEAAVVTAGKTPQPAILNDLYLIQPLPARRDLHIRMSQSPELPRGSQYASLEVALRTSCGNVSGLLFGPGRQVRDAFDVARRDLARFPSERATLDLLERSLNVPIAAVYGSQDADIASAFDLVGRIYFNPRLASCAVIGMGANFNR